MTLRRTSFVAALAAAGVSFVALHHGPIAAVPLAALEQATATAVYYPPAGAWAKKPAADLGMDQAALDAAVQFAQSRESTRAMDFSDQERIFGSMLGSVPNIRAQTNGLVIYKGYVVAEFGDTTWADPTYSVAKSMMATVAGIAVRDGKIASLDEPVGRTVKDGGYDSPRNSLVTWKMHLQQESEWEGDDVRQEGRLRRQGGVRRRRAQAARAEAARHLLRIQRRPHQPPRPVAAAHVQGLGARRVPPRGHGRHRRLEHLAVDSVPQQLRRRRRQAGRLGERRHALGRRDVDQRPGHGPLRLPVAARRQVGRSRRCCRPAT